MILRSALRSARRRPGSTALNVAGLALGLACVMLIALYVQDETQVDAFLPNADRIARVNQKVTDPGREGLWAWTGGAVGEDLAADFPTLEATVRVIQKAGAVRAEAHPERRFREEAFLFADPSFFDVFRYRFVRGSAAALSAPGGAVMSASAAARYFGDADPVGEPITYGGQTLTVRGVVADPPQATHLPFSIVAPMGVFKALNGLPPDARFGSYWWPQMWTYVLLPHAADVPRLEAQMAAFTLRHRDDAAFVPTLEPLRELHFSEATAAPSPSGSRVLVRVFAAIALVVLLLAVVNVVNLTTAQASTRAREVGVRKAVGAGRLELAAGFVAEAVLTCAVALAVAIGVVALALPAFNTLAGKALGLEALRDPTVWAVLAALTLATGLLAGAYPAAVLSGFRPARVLRGAFVGGQGARLRKGLVVVQFTVSIALAAGAAVAFEQLHFLRSAPLGFDDEQVVTVRLPGADWSGSTWGPLKAALAARPEVVAVTAASQRPGFGPTTQLPAETEGRPAGEAPMLGMESVDYGFVETLGLNVVAGRSFSPAFTSDEGVAPDDEPTFHLFERGLIINRAAARQSGWTDADALGKSIRLTAFENGTYYTDVRGTVVGVVDDYHASSFEGGIDPQVFMLAPGPKYNPPSWAIVKVRPGEAAATLAALRSVWDRVAPDEPFEASFLDADLDARYAGEARLSGVVGVFAGLGGLIACLGLFGLAAFAAEQRRREVGVRKVLGASVASVVVLLARDFLVLVAVSAALALPVSWFFSRRWLDGFAFHVPLGAAPFAAVAAGALFVAALTVSGQALRAATASPVRALRSE